MPVPDMPGSFRVYKDMRTQFGYFSSLAYPTQWRVKGPMTAECQRFIVSSPANPCPCNACQKQKAAHKAPEDNCRCGFYGYYLPDRPPAACYSSDISEVFAVLEASGKIVPAELGLRAEKMQIVAALFRHEGAYHDGVDWGIPVYKDRAALLSDWPPRDDTSGICGKTPAELRDQWTERNKDKEPGQFPIASAQYTALAQSLAATAQQITQASQAFSQYPYGCGPGFSPVVQNSPALYQVHLDGKTIAFNSPGNYCVATLGGTYDVTVHPGGMIDVKHRPDPPTRKRGKKGK